MGSGKTFISKILHKKIGGNLIDLDYEISKEMGMPISEIFEKKGEIFFRKKERELLEKYILNEKKYIFSLGGGTPCYYDNISLIKENSVSIYLRARVGTLVDRLLNEKKDRPMIAKLPESMLHEYVGQHLFERNIFYNQADIIIDTDDLSPEEVVEKIMCEIKKR